MTEREFLTRLKRSGMRPAPTGAMLKAWREREKLTQRRAARIACVDIRTWQRWEEGGGPDDLSDLLAVRWGSAP